MFRKLGKHGQEYFAAVPRAKPCDRGFNTFRRDTGGTRPALRCQMQELLQLGHHLPKVTQMGAMQDELTVMVIRLAMRTDFVHRANGDDEPALIILGVLP